MKEGKWRKFFNDLYQLRVEIAFWALLVALAPAGEHTDLFEGIFVLDYGKQVAWMCFIAYLCSAVLMVFTNLVLFYGDIRLNAAKRPLIPKPMPDNRQTVTVFLVCLIPPSVLVACSDWYTLKQQSPLGVTAVILWTGIGFAGAAAAVLLAKALQVLFATPFPGQDAEPHFILPLGWVPLLGPWFERQYWKPGLFSIFARQPGFRWLKLVGQALKKLAGKVGEGYFDYDANGEPGAALPGLGFVTWLAIVVAFFYWLSGWGHLRDLRKPYLATSTFDTPTILHVLIALLLLATLFSGAAFFLDRYRIPLILAILTLLVLTSVVPFILRKSDHVFDMSNQSSVTVFCPRETLVSKRGDRFIAIAAAGGGIQAAAWTAKVLGELRQNKAFGADFSGSVAVMSGVSGGSAGILNYLTTYPGVSEHPVDAGKSIEDAEHDSLEGIAWGLVHPDLRRVVLPFAVPAGLDRGWALQRLLAQASGTSNVQLSELSRRARELPVLLINSTETETGTPIVFPTSDFPPKDEAAGIDNFRSVYGTRADLSVATAVRLSATFPYVTPAARAASGPPFHFVDAGYYDAYGMVSLLAWIRAAFLTNPSPSVEATISRDMERKRILILEINGFPRSGAPHACSEPWPYQLIAPLLALYNVREHSQQARNEFEFALQSKAAWFQKQVSAVEFRYNPTLKECSGDPPLSWHLTPKERACIDDAWKSIGPINKGPLGCVAAFLSGSDDLSKCSLPLEARDQPTVCEPRLLCPFAFCQ